MGPTVRAQFAWNRKNSHKWWWDWTTSPEHFCTSRWESRWSRTGGGEIGSGDQYWWWHWWISIIWWKSSSAGEIGSPGQPRHPASSLQPIPDSWPGSPGTGALIHPLYTLTTQSIHAKCRLDSMKEAGSGGSSMSSISWLAIFLESACPFICSSPKSTTRVSAWRVQETRRTRSRGHGEAPKLLVLYTGSSAPPPSFYFTTTCYIVLNTIIQLS